MCTCLLTRIEWSSDHAETLHFPWDSHAGTEIEDAVFNEPVAIVQVSVASLGRQVKASRTCSCRIIADNEVVYGQEGITTMALDLPVRMAG